MSKHGKAVFVGVMAVLAMVIVLLAVPPRADAIPAFSRQYNTSCSTCHIDFPKLNDFGKAFKDAGFKFPTDDESMLKIPPVLLGAPAQAELWPKAIWPGTIPGQLPVGLRMNNYFQVVSANPATSPAEASPRPERVSFPEPTSRPVSSASLRRAISAVTLLSGWTTTSVFPAPTRTAP